MVLQHSDSRMATAQFEDRAFRVLIDQYVKADEGTGIVHQAPAFGEDDHRIAIAHGVLRPEDMPPCPIDDAGRFTSEVPDFQGQHVKVRNRKVVFSPAVVLISIFIRPPTRRFKRC